MVNAILVLSDFKEFETISQNPQKFVGELNLDDSIEIHHSLPRLNATLDAAISSARENGDKLKIFYTGNMQGFEYGSCCGNSVPLDEPGLLEKFEQNKVEYHKIKIIDPALN